VLAKLFNQRNKELIGSIKGAVTTGTDGKFFSEQTARYRSLSEIILLMTQVKF
jgi:hypothetical protein